MIFCDGGPCPIRHQCDRFLAPRPGRHKCFTEPPYNPETHHCDHFLAPFQPSPADIETRAYFLWQSLGCPQGKDLEIWAQAEASWPQHQTSPGDRPETPHPDEAQGLG